MIKVVQSNSGNKNIPHLVKNSFTGQPVKTVYKSASNSESGQVSIFLSPLLFSWGHTGAVGREIFVLIFFPCFVLCWKTQFCLNFSRKHRKSAKIPVLKHLYLYKLLIKINIYIRKFLDNIDHGLLYSDSHLPVGDYELHIFFLYYLIRLALNSFAIRNEILHMPQKKKFFRNCAEPQLQCVLHYLLIHFKNTFLEKLLSCILKYYLICNF